MKIKNIFLPIGSAFKKIMNTLPDIVLQCEKAWKDGIIDPQERKNLAMYCIERICQEWGYKPNWFVRWIISMAIDRLAKALPPKGNNIIVPDYVLKIAKDWN